MFELPPMKTLYYWSFALITIIVYVRTGPLNQTYQKFLALLCYRPTVFYITMLLWAICISIHLRRSV